MRDRTTTAESETYLRTEAIAAHDGRNLVELTALQRRVADALRRPAGRLVFTAKSAHIYDTEPHYMGDVVGACIPAVAAAVGLAAPVGSVSGVRCGRPRLNA